MEEERLITSAGVERIAETLSVYRSDPRFGERLLAMRISLEVLIASTMSVISYEQNVLAPMIEEENKL